jgi:hypothetical protein
MRPKKITFPAREIIERQAAEMPPKVPLWDYRAAMEELRDKGYSYGEIADWISDRLGVTVTRNRVAYVINAHPLAQEKEEKEDEEEELADEAEESQY